MKMNKNEKTEEQLAQEANPSLNDIVVVAWTLNAFGRPMLRTYQRFDRNEWEKYDFKPELNEMAEDYFRDECTALEASGHVVTSSSDWNHFRVTNSHQFERDHDLTGFR